MNTRRADPAKTSRGFLVYLVFIGSGLWLGWMLVADWDSVVNWEEYQFLIMAAPTVLIIVPAFDSPMMEYLSRRKESPSVFSVLVLLSCVGLILVALGMLPLGAMILLAAPLGQLAILTTLWRKFVERHQRPPSDTGIYSVEAMRLPLVDRIFRLVAFLLLLLPTLLFGIWQHLSEGV